MTGRTSARPAEAGCAPRIVSLLPAATEWICAFGYGHWLVGVSHECDFPPEVRCLPAVTRTRVDVTAASAVIQEQVQQLVASQGLYELDVERFRELAPDTVIVQDVCGVCAVSADLIAQAFGGKMPAGLHVVTLSARSLAGIYADVRRLGASLGCEDTAEALARKLEQEVEQIRWRSQRARYRPRVLCLEWLEPPMVAGHWIPEFVRIAGGHAVLTEPGQPSRRVSIAEIQAAEPEVLVMMPCGFSLERALREVHTWSRPAGWWKLPAVENGRVYVVESNAFLTRPGPRIRQGAWLLAGVIQPSLFARSIPPGAVARLED